MTNRTNIYLVLDQLIGVRKKEREIERDRARELEIGRNKVWGV